MISTTDISTTDSSLGDSRKTGAAETPTTDATPLESTHPDYGRIRSYARRRGHITLAQKMALERLTPQWAVPYRPEPLDYAAAFGRSAPTILEIGFGMGETTERIATARADENFLGVEVFDAGVGALLKRIEQADIGNIRIIQHDAVDVLRDMIPPDSLAGVHIYFPDPWPKARHHKRRLIQAPLVALLATRIRPGGYLHCATDWENYAEQMLAVLSAQALLRNTCDDYAPRPSYRPQTKFEIRGLKLGHAVRDLIFTRIPATP